MRTAAIAGAMALAAWVQATAVEWPLGTWALDDAVAIGQSPIEGQRATFHARYHRDVGMPPVDSVEIVTPFRRIALAAERQARAGAGPFSHRQALDVLQRVGNGLDLVVELTFHPHHTYVGVPDYDIVLASAGRAIVPLSIEPQPRYGTRVGGQPPTAPAVPDARGRGLPLTGATITARFDAAPAADPVMTLAMRERDVLVVEVPIALTGLR